MADIGIQEKAKRLKAFVECLPDFEVVAPPAPYGHMGAVITDAMLQAGLNWESVVKPRIERVRGYTQARTTSGFRDLLHTSGPRAVLNWNHPEKIARIKGVIDFFCACGLETETEFREWLGQEENMIRLKGLRGVGDKTADYFRFIVGIPTTAVDRHIKNFLALAGIAVSRYDEAREIVHCTADMMGISRATLDHSIWKYMSTKKPKAKADACRSFGGTKMGAIRPHDGSVSLRHAFEDAWNFLNSHGAAELSTSTGHRFRALASMSRDRKVIRFVKERVECGRAYACCWGRYYNCARTRIGMYTAALDEFMMGQSLSD
ncbi:MAG: hypothetical protein A4E73_00134 [Syntrophaceae bacterium PtaU1.Bin231]|nr:MAG: hypothetical protein A4E73_00134 [Syntrophaceae bacterium PtaU1.Bin231]